ncbi:hypothetical protein Bbelb_049170 [Branchiostoma belcheri]|nr:hypothetical protein Bbelb_049170 [Branchiostoma belcheri]
MFPKYLRRVTCAGPYIPVHTTNYQVSGRVRRNHRPAHAVADISCTHRTHPGTPSFTGHVQNVIPQQPLASGYSQAVIPSLMFSADLVVDQLLMSERMDIIGLLRSSSLQIVASVQDGHCELDQEVSVGICMKTAPNFNRLTSYLRRLIPTVVYIEPYTETPVFISCVQDTAQWSPMWCIWMHSAIAGTGRQLEKFLPNYKDDCVPKTIHERELFL